MAGWRGAICLTGICGLVASDEGGKGITPHSKAWRNSGSMTMLQAETIFAKDWQW